MFKLCIENTAERGILCHYCTAVNLFNFIFCTSSQLRTEAQQVQIQDKTTQDGAAISRSVDIYLIFSFQNLMCVQIK